MNFVHSTLYNNILDIFMEMYVVFCVYFVAINNEITYLVPVSDRISVLDGDYLGL